MSDTASRLEILIWIQFHTNKTTVLRYCLGHELVHRFVTAYAKAPQAKI
jgi:hypothetical protein